MASRIEETQGDTDVEDTSKDVTPRSLGSKNKLAGIFPEGYPRLPPIKKPKYPKEDPFAKSKMMTFRLSTYKQQLLMKIL